MAGDCFPRSSTTFRFDTPKVLGQVLTRLEERTKRGVLFEQRSASRQQPFTSTPQKY